MFEGVAGVLLFFASVGLLAFGAVIFLFVLSLLGGLFQ